jgi:hypothetical protein
MAGKARSAEHIAHGCAVCLRFTRPNSWHLPEQPFVHPVICREQKSSHVFEQGLLSHFFALGYLLSGTNCVCVCVFTLNFLSVCA